MSFTQDLQMFQQTTLLTSYIQDQSTELENKKDLNESIHEPCGSEIICS